MPLTHNSFSKSSSSIPQTHSMNFFHICTLITQYETANQIIVPVLPCYYHHFTSTLAMSVPKSHTPMSEFNTTPPDGM